MSQFEGIDKLLRDHPFFSGMKPDYLELIAGCGANERIDAGQYLFREGEAADRFYLIRHGAVAVELHAPGREPMVLQTLGEGEILGSSWIVPPYRWLFDARAVQLTRVVGLDAKCLRDKCEADHSLGFDLMKRFAPVLSARLAAARLQLFDMYGKPGERRG
ncbi:cyclic nucleotide-binding domain-containing protein [Thioalbus denitrificans]|uniref:Cyclic nucleotide-binding protein n=1 Tax=Thioalbus denitrificans TaxID=547122 RepID=A0A369C7L7_9GAMM|nr:cyclic nucleotide-binding domain-containing protein [Thioalbus denitrificans]RCX29909.1 cyclic nucleotide-binding protein [Thioalbus denitrificans]